MTAVPRAALAAAKLSVTHEEELDKLMEFKAWAARYDAVMQALLRSMPTLVPPQVKTVLQPQGDGDALTLHLREGLFIAKRS